jgi:predicted ferric reductase
MTSVGTAAHAATWGNSSTGGSSPYQNDAIQLYLDGLNKSLGHNYLWALLGVVGLLLANSAVRRFNAHLRHLASMSGTGALRYFSSSSPVLCSVKSALLYAPLLFYRRAREVKFSRHVNFGTIPTRFQALFIVLITATNLFACTWNIPWSDPELQVLPILRNRTGSLSVVNLIPIMVMASIKNPLISFLDISYDTFNLMHRWFGRLAVLEAVTHTICWLMAKVQSSGWSGVTASMQAPFIYTGSIATICLVLILLSSPKVFRNLAYEFFLHLHIVLVVLMLVFLWMHLKGLPQRGLLLGAVIIWAVSRSLRLGTLLYRSVGRGGSKAKIEPLGGGAVKITLTVARPWKFRPGQSLYLTIPAIGLWTAHPFSVAWSGAEDSLSQSLSRKSSFNEKSPIIRIQTRELERATGEESISLIVKKHTGLTHKLWNRAMTGQTSLPVTALVEGPYGTERSLSSYGTVVLFASGVGITHQLGYVKKLVEGYGQGTVAAQRVTLVWVVPTTECLDWIRPWMHEILAMEGRREVLKVLLCITRAGLSQVIKSPSEQVQMSRGRPDVESIIRREALHKMGCMGVSVCAGGGLADEVRRASRLMLDKGVNLDLIEEGFGW